MKRFLFFSSDLALKSLSILSLLLYFTASGQYSYTTLGGTYSQDFNNLSATAAPSSAIAGGSLANVNTSMNGWFFSESGTSSNTSYTATNGSSASGDTFSLGASSTTDRALGGLQSGSLIPTYGFYFTNNTGSTVTSLQISYTGEQWRLGNSGRNDRLDFQYSTDATSMITGTWIDVDVLDFIAPISTGAVGALDGNLSTNRILISNTISGLSIANGSKVFIRWNDFNATGADDALGIDDFSITASATNTSTITYANFQFPTSNNINEGDTYTVYGRVYADGITNFSGQGAGISAWVGYSSTSTDPSTGTWNWVPLSYFGDDGANNDEYSGLLGSGIAPGTYNVVTRFRIGTGAYVYGGKNNAIWNSAADNGSLTVNPNVVDFANFQYQATGTMLLGENHDVYGQVYEPGVTPGAGQGVGITAEVGYSLNANTNPNTWANWFSTNYNSSVTNNNDEYVRNIGPDLSVTGTYYLAFRYKKTGSTTWIYGGTNGIWNNDSAVLTVQSAPTITSTLTKSSMYGTADSYTITASGSATVTYNATGLPTGLSVNTTTGVISGTPTANVGSYNVSISATNAGGTDTKILVWTITQKSLTITGLTAENKIYDGTTSATLSGTPTLNTIVSGDDVSVSGTPTVTFATKTVGTSKSVTVSGYSLSGTKAGNYTVSQPAGLTSNITAKALTVTGASAQNKVYDNTTAATITGATLVGAVSGDSVALTGATAGTFASATAGTSIAVSTSFGISGTDAANYLLTQPAGLSADITKANPVITPSVINVTVGGTYALPGAVTSTSPGTLSYSMTDNAAATLTGGNTINGGAVGANTLTVNQAASANYNAASASVSVNVSAFSNGDYRTVANGNWIAANTTMWETFSGGNWITPATVPTNDTTHNFYINNVVTLSGSNTTKNIIINNNGILNTSTSTPTFANVLVKSGGIFNKEGNTVIVNGLFEVEDGGTFTFKHTDNTKSRSTTIWAGTERFHPNSIFKILTVDGTAMTVIQAINDISTYTENGVTACFGNIIVDCSAGKMNLVPTGFNLQLTAKDLVFRNNSDTTALSTGDITTTIGGNLIVENTYAQTINFASTASTVNLIIKGDLIHNGTKALRPTTNLGSNSNITIEGNLSITNGGSFIMNGAAGALTGTSIANLKGNLLVSATSIINSTATGNNNFNLIGTTGAQTIDVANAATASNIAFNANSGSYVKLINQNLALGTNSKFNVLSGATLDFGFSGNTALNILRVGSSSGQSFSAANSSTLKITSPEGLSNGTSVYTGNVQIGSVATARIFDQGAVYHYIGKSNESQVTLNGADQVTGSGLPSQITGKVIAELETQNITQDDLILRSSGTTTFGTTSGVNGILEIRKGKVIDEPGSGFRNYNGAIDDGDSDTQRGDLKMNGGRYVISGAGTKPALSGNYTLTAGTIEFTGTAATKIRTGTPAKQYFNVDVSGTNVETAGKNLVVNNLLKVTSPTAVLTVPEILDDAATPYVVTAKKGFQVTSGGKAIFKNNANLIQDVDAANTGNITMERKANVPTFQYNYWASPVKNQALYSLYPGIAKDRVMVYNSSNDKFTVLTTASNPLSAFGKGYSIKGSSDAAYQPQLTATFLGEPNNETSAGTSTIPLSDAGNNYNLIGNPYPSNLDLLALYGDADNTSKFYSGADEMPTAYFWDNTSNKDLNQVGSSYASYSQNNYALLNLTSGTGTPAPRIGAVKQPNGIVKPGQGFIIRAAESAGNLTLKNSFRTTAVKKGSTDGVYYRSEPETTDRYWLKLTTPTSMNIVIAVGYYAAADNAFERFDSTVFSEAASENIYSLSSDAKKLAIQGKKGTFSQEDVVPLGLKTFTPGSQQISLEGKEGNFESQPIYLKDKVLNTITNLSQGPYVFSSIKGIEDNRFEIIYKDNLVLGSNSSQKSEFTVYRDGKSYVIKSSKSLGKIELYDLSGRMISTNYTEQKSFSIDSETLPNGVFIIKVENSGDLKTKKIIK